MKMYYIDSGNLQHISDLENFSTKTNVIIT